MISVFRGMLMRQNVYSVVGKELVQIQVMFYDQSSTSVFHSVCNVVGCVLLCLKGSAIEQGNIHSPTYFLLHTCTNTSFRC